MDLPKASSSGNNDIENVLRLTVEMQNELLSNSTPLPTNYPSTQKIFSKARSLLSNLAGFQKLKAFDENTATPSSGLAGIDFLRMTNRCIAKMDQLFNDLEEQHELDASKERMTANSEIDPDPAKLMALKRKIKAQRKGNNRNLRQQQNQSNITDNLEEHHLDHWISLERTPFYYIQSVEELKSLVKHVKKYRIFAFDLELTVFGLRLENPRNPEICLMQISTRDEDYVIDVLQLKYGIVLLQELFGNEHIVKVVHGSQDVKLLQKQFGISTHNYYDTSGGGSRNLQELVETACGIYLDKTLSIADWKVRPLPDEMFDYARSDTHYLLRCYDYLVSRP